MAAVALKYGGRLTHGFAKGGRRRVYRIWEQMKQRCVDPNHVSYPRYGARGIEVCDEWRSSFEAFLADMGEPPTDQHSIDRIDNDGGYARGNCRWATRVEQQANKRARV
jgi:hypothetical protein